MLITVVWKEFTEKVHTLRFAMALVCLAVGVPILTYARTRAFLGQSYQVTKHISESYARMRDYDRFAIFDYDAIVGAVPTPSSIFASGLDLQGADFRVIRDWSDEVSVDLPINASGDLFQELDMVVIIGIVLGLLAVVFSYDSVAGERNDGTLALCLASPISRGILLLGKWLGGYLALIAPFILGLATSVVVVLSFAGSAATQGFWMSLGGFAVIGVLYAAALYSAGLLASTAASRPATAAAVLLMVWVAWVLIIPNVSPLIATGFVRIPSAHDRQQAMAELERQEWSKKSDLMKKGVEEQNLTHGSLEFYTLNSELNLLLWQTLGDEISKVEGRYLALARRQARLSEYISRLSPYASATLAALNISGAGPSDRFRISRQLHDFKKDFFTYVWKKEQEFFKSWRAKYKDHVGQLDLRRALPEPSFHFGDDFPRFEYATRPLEERLLAALPDVVLLAFWAAAFYMAAYLRFARAQAY